MKSFQDETAFDVRLCFSEFHGGHEHENIDDQVHQGRHGGQHPESIGNIVDENVGGGQKCHKNSLKNQNILLNPVFVDFLQNGRKHARFTDKKKTF